VKLSPGAATGMAIGPQIVQPEPAAIVTSDMGAKVLRGVHRTGTAVCERHGLDKGSLLRFTFLAYALIKKHSPRFPGSVPGPDHLGGHFWSHPTIAGTL
jgi:hypothetical protein